MQPRMGFSVWGLWRVPRNWRWKLGQWCVCRRAPFFRYHFGFQWRRVLGQGSWRRLLWSRKICWVKILIRRFGRWSRFGRSPFLRLGMGSLGQGSWKRSRFWQGLWRRIGCWRVQVGMRLLGGFYPRLGAGRQLSCGWSWGDGLLIFTPTVSGFIPNLYWPRIYRQGRRQRWPPSWHRWMRRELWVL